MSMLGSEPSVSICEVVPRATSMTIPLKTGEILDEIDHGGEGASTL